MTLNELFEAATGMIEAGETHGMSRAETVEYVGEAYGCSREVIAEVTELVLNDECPAEPVKVKRTMTVAEYNAEKYSEERQRGEYADF